MVTHSSTSRPVQCLCMAERTGCPVLTDLWSYVFTLRKIWNIIVQHKEKRLMCRPKGSKRNGQDRDTQATSISPRRRHDQTPYMH